MQGLAVLVQTGGQPDGIGQVQTGDGGGKDGVIRPRGRKAGMAGVPKWFWRSVALGLIVWWLYWFVSYRLHWW